MTPSRSVVDGFAEGVNEPEHNSLQQYPSTPGPTSPESQNGPLMPSSELALPGASQDL